MSHFTQKDLDYNLKTIDADVKAGRLTREEAHKNVQKIKENFRNKSNEKAIDELIEKRKKKGIII